jgi:hypothetical protein
MAESELPPVESVKPPSESESRSAAALRQKGVSKPRRQVRGSEFLPTGQPWSQVKADWLTGAFTMRGLAEAYNIALPTLNGRMKREGWPAPEIRGMVARALPGLVDGSSADPLAAPDSNTVEALTAIVEGRPIDHRAAAQERASTQAKSKAAILRAHRDASSRYMLLAVRVLDLLEEYSQGRLPFAFVLGKGQDGAPVAMSFNLLSKQHGLMDGVDKLGTILGKAIELERHANALQNVDGDGNAMKKDAQNLVASMTDDELASEIAKLNLSLSRQGRETPIPLGLRGA